MPRYAVTIVETATGEVVKRMPAHSEREAERIAHGARFNLNHERFHVAVEPDEPRADG